MIAVSPEIPRYFTLQLAVLIHLRNPCLFLRSIFCWCSGRTQYVVLEMERNQAAAKQNQARPSTQLLLSFPPFTVDILCTPIVRTVQFHCEDDGTPPSTAALSATQKPTLWRNGIARKCFTSLFRKLDMKIARIISNHSTLLLGWFWINAQSSNDVLLG